jgi:hypothetical protein
MTTVQNDDNATDLDRRSVLGLASGAAIVAAGVLQCAGRCYVGSRL